MASVTTTAYIGTFRNTIAITITSFFSIGIEIMMDIISNIILLCCHTPCKREMFDVLEIYILWAGGGMET